MQGGQQVWAAIFIGSLSLKILARKSTSRNFTFSRSKLMEPLAFYILLFIYFTVQILLNHFYVLPLLTCTLTSEFIIMCSNIASPSDSPFFPLNCIIFLLAFALQIIWLFFTTSSLIFSVQYLVNSSSVFPNLLPNSKTVCITYPCTGKS